MKSPPNYSSILCQKVKDMQIFCDNEAGSFGSVAIHVLRVFSIFLFGGKIDRICTWFSCVVSSTTVYATYRRRGAVVKGVKYISTNLSVNI